MPELRGAVDLDRLLALALADPSAALRAARELLAGNPTPVEAAVAHQSAGIVLRDFGDVTEAISELRAARTWARRAGGPALEADVLSTLGSAWVMAGSTRRGLAALDEAVALTPTGPDARLLVRRAHVRWLIGRHLDARDDADRAVALLGDSGDSVWTARAYAHRAVANLALGAVERADRDYVRAEELFAGAGQRVEYATTRHDRAAAAFARGDLPRALTLLDDAERLLGELDIVEPELLVTRCRVLIAAGLFREALDVADTGATRLRAQRGAATRLAELLHAAAVAAQAAGDLDTATARSAAATAMFRAQRRPWWTAHASLVEAGCAFAAGRPPDQVLARAVRLAKRLHELHSPYAADAHLLAGRAAVRLDRGAIAARELLAAAHDGGRDPRARTVGWLARAVLHEFRQEWAPMLAACSRGLDHLERQLDLLGGTELRAEATARGADLAAIALRHAVRTRDARRLLEWSDRRRATALVVPPVRPAADDTTQADLTALRALARRRGDDAPAPELLAEQRRLEAAVRQRARRRPAAPTVAAERVRLAPLRAALADTDLVELAEVDGALYAAVVAGTGPPRWFDIGPAAPADRAVTRARFALRRPASWTGAPELDLDRLGARLQATLLGGAADALRGGPVVIVPSGRLHAVPWAMMPCLAGIPVTVAPSSAAWLRARRTSPPADGRVVLVGGPGLATGTAEVRGLAERYPGAVVLAGRDATCERVLAAMDGAGLVHVAAHGTFRADSPLLSSLVLADGPLTAYDLERLTRAPHRMVLSSCDSAVGAPTGADELLGVVGVLMSLGCVGVVASVVPVDDPATVPLMLELHRWLADHPTAEALLRARESVRDESGGRITGDAFLALGA